MYGNLNFFHLLSAVITGNCIVTVIFTHDLANKELPGDQICSVQLPTGQLSLPDGTANRIICDGHPTLIRFSDKLPDLQHFHANLGLLYNHIGSMLHGILLSLCPESANAENIVVPTAVIAMACAVGAVLVVVGRKPALSLVSGIILQIMASSQESTMVAVLISVSHAGHEAFAVFRFRTDRYFSQPVLT